MTAMGGAVILKGANRRTCRSCNRAGSNSSSTPRPPGCSASESWEDEQHVMQSRSIRQSGQPTRASASRMRAFDWDLIRGGHYGQPSCEPRFIGAEHMAAPTIPATYRFSLPTRSRPPAHHELLNEKEPGRGSDQALSGRRRGAYCTRNVGPKALPQASSAFRSIVCENIPNIAPHIAANIRMGMVCLRLHSEHQLSRGLRSSVQNRSSTNLRLYKSAHCNLFAIGTLFALFNPTGAGPRCQMH